MLIVASGSGTRRNLPGGASPCPRDAVLFGGGGCGRHRYGDDDGSGRRNGRKWCCGRFRHCIVEHTVMTVMPLTAISAAVPTIHLMTRMMATFKSALVTMCSRHASIR